LVTTGCSVAADVDVGDVDAVGNLVGAEQATSPNVIATANSVALQRITRDRSTGPRPDPERIQFAVCILLPSLSATQSIV
jgi:hypothetical protein